jgi:hypothetical protein
MFKVVKPLEVTGRVSVWTMVLSRYAGPGVSVLGAGFEATLDVLELMFSEKYCSSPLSRNAIEHGEHVNAHDIERCLDIAFELSGLPRRKDDDPEDPDDRERARDDFDLDDCVFMVLRYSGMNWDEVRGLTWQELLWFYEMAMGYQLKYEIPMHGVDTSKAVMRFEQAKKNRELKAKGLPVAGSTRISDAQFLDMWDSWTQEQEEKRVVAEGTIDKLNHLKVLMGDKE